MKGEKIHCQFHFSCSCPIYVIKYRETLEFSCEHGDYASDLKPIGSQLTVPSRKLERVITIIIIIIIIIIIVIIIHCFQIELEFRSVDFCGGRETGEPGEKPSEQGRGTNNKLNPHLICL